MDENQITLYDRGRRSAWVTFLHTCLQNLGYSDTALQRNEWILEREGAIAKLRSLCDDFGDNNWTDHLSLGDVIEKHLGRHLYE